MADYQCKGSHAELARAWFDEHLGAGSLDRLAGDVKAYPAMVLPGTWYDVAPLARAFDAASAKLDKPVPELVRMVTRQNALQDLTTIYRVFLRVATPVRFLTFTPTLWRNLVRFADATVVLNEPGHYVGLCSKVPRPFVDWAAGGWLGFLPTAIELAGGKNTTATIQSKRPQLGDDWSFECYIRYGIK